MNGKKILITGASGFVGACLARKLVEKGNEVHLFLRKESNIWRLKDIIDKFTIHRVDVRDRDVVIDALGEIRPRVVYHLATYGAYPHQKDAQKMIETNVLGTVNLVDGCASISLERFVNAGSSSEYGVKEGPMREEDVLEPNSLYGITKAAGTQYCKHMARERGFPAVTLRIFAAYGYYEDRTRLIPSLILSCLENKKPELSSPSSVRDFIFIDDMLNAFEKAAESPDAPGEVLNLGTGKQHSVKEVTEAILSLTGCERKPVWGSIEKRQVEPESWVADISKTERILGWKPEFGLKDGLDRDIRWFKDNLAIYK